MQHTSNKFTLLEIFCVVQAMELSAQHVQEAPPQTITGLSHCDANTFCTPPSWFAEPEVFRYLNLKGETLTCLDGNAQTYPVYGQNDQAALLNL